MKCIVVSIIAIMTLYTSDVLSCTESKDPATVVQAELDAYNVHDVDLFASCYSSDIQVKDLRKNGLDLAGKEDLVKTYQFLKSVPEEYKVILEQRMVNGPIVIDYERLTGLGEKEEDRLVFAIYEVRDGKIKNVWFPPPL
ncbi:nuclear transport factor 2 family protein [Pseudoalteromonas rhizosphaerae]|uniref:nuclear transport factor 2 family protein n=1 Tax=Pseudoalteromonas rhizosphaerae TaxID=2518973 RepID=UPI002147B091|nr:nuclear transport factor 2 family protein [Pseudoalteromonas rhizosphaerae]